MASATPPALTGIAAPGAALDVAAAGGASVRLVVVGLDGNVVEALAPRGAVYPGLPLSLRAHGREGVLFVSLLPVAVEAAAGGRERVTLRAGGVRRIGDERRLERGACAAGGELRTAAGARHAVTVSDLSPLGIRVRTGYAAAPGERLDLLLRTADEPLRLEAEVARSVAAGGGERDVVATLVTLSEVDWRRLERLLAVG
jgi:hypothetical protein